MNNNNHPLFIRIVALLLLSFFPTTLFAGEVLYYHTDNFGTPMAMTDKNGKVVWRADELPFGEDYQTEEIPERNNRRFLGKQLDKETGLVSMGARYLDPKTGRFTQPDPVGLVDPATGKVNQEMLLNPQRLNRYVYALNNPYKYIDPEGNFAILGAALVGAAIAYFTHPDIANAPTSSSSPTYQSHGARNIALGVVGGVATTEVASVLAVRKITSNMQGMSKMSRKRFKRTINNLSKPESPGLSQQKLNQLRRISSKANAKVRVDLDGVKGSGVRPHAHVEGLGTKVESRHIWLKKGVR